jgi:hypothetical protein
MITMHRFRLGTIAVATWMAAAAAPALAAPPPNDLFENATPLGDAPVEVSTTTVSASRQPGEPIHGLQTVWFAYRPTVSQRVAVEAQAPDVSPRVVAVYTGPSLGDLERVGIDESSEARVAFDAAAGGTYWIASGRTYSTGPYVVRIRPMPLPPNDAFDDAMTLRVPGEHAGNLADATTELGEPRGEHTVWYRFRARRTGRLWLEATPSCAQVSVYEGRSVDELKSLKIGRFDDFRARRGRVYHASVECSFPGFGEYSIRLSDGSIAGDGVEMAIDPGQTVETVRSRGLRLSVSAKRRVEIEVELRVSRSTMRRLGLDDRVLGSTRGRIKPGRPLPAAVRLTREARRALDGEQNLNATVRLELPRSKVPERFISLPVTL